MFRSTLLCAVVSTFCLCGTANAAFVIDTFLTPSMAGQTSWTDSVGPEVFTAATGQPVIGGSREIFVLKTGQVGDGNQKVEASANQSGTEYFNFDQFSSSAMGIARIVYDGAADGVLNPTGFTTPLNLLGSPNPEIIFADIQSTGSGLLLTINLYNATTGLVFSSGTQVVPDGYKGNLSVLYSSFTGAGGAETLSNVGAIEIIIDGSHAPGADLRLGVVTSAGKVPNDGPTVPEPTSIALAGMGALVSCAFGLRRRRQNAAA